MKRREFVKKAGIAGLASGACAPNLAEAKSRIRWKLASTWSPKLPILQESAEIFAELVEKASAGRLKIKVYAGGELIPPLGVFDAVSAGTIEVGVGSSYYWNGKVNAAGIFAALPFGMNAQQQNAWLFGGGGLELWRELYAKYELIPFPFGNTGTQMAGWFKQEIKSLKDIKGLKMRIPGYGGKVMAELGANVVLMAGGEIYTALERGTIDATEWINPFHDERLGLQRAAKFYHYPGWQEPGSNMELSISAPAWRALPEDLKSIVEAAASYVHNWSLAKSEAENGPALNRLVNTHGVKVLPLPEEVMKALRSTSEKVMNEVAEKDADSRKIMAAYRSFQKSVSPWHKVSESAMSAWL